MMVADLALTGRFIVFSPRTDARGSGVICWYGVAIVDREFVPLIATASRFLQH
jgi:hypothetical protein